MVSVTRPSDLFSQITGYWHSAGISPDGSVQCWGDNSRGQCDPPDSTFVKLAAGGLTPWACVPMEAFWHGEMMRTVNQQEHQVESTDIAAGYLHSIALRLDGTVVCWGDSSQEPV